MKCQKIESYDENFNPIYKDKKKFETLEDAILAAKKVNSKEHIINKVVSYKCDFCHKFHIGRNGKELKEKDRIKFKKSLKRYK